MADWWLGEANETSASVLWRATSAGVAEIICVDAGAVTGPFTTDTAADDGVIRFDLTGLPATANGDRYAFSVTLDDVEQFTGQVKTMPQRGTAIFAVASCVNWDSVFPGDLFEGDNFCGLLIADDDTYCEGYATLTQGNKTCYGMTIKPFSNTINSLGPQTDSALMRMNYDYHLFNRRRFSQRDLIQRGPYLITPGDHDGGRPGDNATYGDVAHVNDIRAIASNVAEAEHFFDLALEGYAAYYKGNPHNNNEPDPLHRSCYFKWRFGDVLYISCDLWQFADLASDPDPKERLGSLQREFIRDALSTTDATFKIVNLSGMMYSPIWVNSYAYDLSLLEDVFSDWRNWETPGGLLLLSGDAHRATFTFNHNIPVCQINATPVNSTFHSGDAITSLPYVMWNIQGVQPTEMVPCIGRLTCVYGQHVQMEAIDQAGYVRYAVRVTPGSNWPYVLTNGEWIMAEQKAF